MDQDNDSGRRKQDNHGPGAGGFVWYLVSIMVVSLFVALFLFKNTGYEVDFYDFEKLIESCRRDEDGKRANPGNDFHMVIEGKPPKASKIYYSDLQQVKIDTNRIEATVTREVVEKAGQPVSRGQEDLCQQKQ